MTVPYTPEILLGKNRKCPWFHIRVRYSQRYQVRFWFQDHQTHTVGWNNNTRCQTTQFHSTWLARIQNGGRQTGSTYISASTTDRRAVPTAKPMFSGSADPADSWPTTSDLDRPNLTQGMEINFYPPLKNIIWKMRRGINRLTTATSVDYQCRRHHKPIWTTPLYYCWSVV